MPLMFHPLHPVPLQDAPMSSSPTPDKQLITSQTFAVTMVTEPDMGKRLLDCKAPGSPEWDVICVSAAYVCECVNMCQCACLCMSWSTTPNRATPIPYPIIPIQLNPFHLWDVPARCFWCIPHLSQSFFAFCFLLPLSLFV